jgi:hypothetical protein
MKLVVELRCKRRRSKNELGYGNGVLFDGDWVTGLQSLEVRDVRGEHVVR